MGDIKPFLCGNSDVTAVRGEWEKWFRSFELYLNAEEITDAVKKKNKLLHLAGPQLQDVIFNLPGALVDNKDPGVFDILVAKLNEHFTPTRNSTFERHLFRAITSQEGEDINKFLLRLRQQASKCSFGKTEAEIVENCLKDKIIDSWAPVNLKRKLLEKELPLTEVVELCQLHEHITNQTQRMEKPQQEVVNRVFNKQNRLNKFDECGRCGQKSHGPTDERCPAVNAKCNKCGLLGHFAKKCRTRMLKRERDRSPFNRNARRMKTHIRYVAEENSSPERSQRVDCLLINDGSGKDGIIQCVLGGQAIKMIIDSGCRFNLLSEKDWALLKFNNATLWNSRTTCESCFKAYAANQPLEVIQVFESTIAVGVNEIIDTFYVIKNGNQSLLGRNSAVQLQVLKLGIGVNKVDCIKPFQKIKGLRVTLSIDQTIKPVQQPVRRVPIALEKQVEGKLNEALSLGIIEAVVGPSQWISPIVTVFKDNGELRICVDMRQANKAVKRENYPLPTFEMFMTKLRGTKVFSRLDLRWAYHQVELEESSRYITTFITHKGLFRYKRLMFGISSAPEIFQRIIENLLSSCTNVLNYIDDIVVFGDSSETHDKALEAVLKVLKENNVQLNEDKCVWGVKEMKFLGHILSDKGIAPDPTKIETISKFRAPVTKEELRSFLGLVTYVGKFITNLATITEPLRQLLKSDTKFIWNQLEQNSFDVLKKQLTELPTLSFFNLEYVTRVVADASPVALGAVLLQFDFDNKPLIISFASKSLTDVERRYSQTEKESLALVWAVERFYYYLAGHEFELVTDHKPLEAIFKPTSKPPARIERWLLRLQSFKFKVIYRSGKENIADPLSRLCEIGDASAFDDQCEQGVFRIVETSTPFSVTIQELVTTSAEDEEIVDAIDWLKNDNWPRDTKNCYYSFRYELASVATILLRGTRLVVPRVLRPRVLELAHEGHPGESAMKRRIRAKVWWPMVDRDVECHVKRCKDCLLVSQSNNPPPMKRTAFPNGPWQCVASDLLGPLPNNQYIFVLIDYYSRYQEVKFTTRITSEVIIQILKEIFCRLGLPLSLRADNGRQYVSAEFKAFCKNNNIELITTPPYWPQANGEVENMNRSLVKRLKIAHANQRDYVEEIQNFIMMYNVTPHGTTGTAPSQLMFGRAIRDKIPGINDLTEDMWDSAARDLDIVNKHKGKIDADGKRGAKASDVKVGDRVLIKNVTFPNKLTTTFDVAEYIVASRKGNEVVVTNGERSYRRHVSHVKKVPTGQVESQEPGIGNTLTPATMDEPNENLAQNDQGTDGVGRPGIILKLQNKEGMWQPV